MMFSENQRAFQAFLLLLHSLCDPFYWQIASFLEEKRGKVTAKKTGCGFYHEIWGILMIMVFN